MDFLYAVENLTKFLVHPCTNLQMSLYSSFFRIAKNYPGWVAQLVGALSHAPKGCSFDPWTGHKWEVTNPCFSLISMFVSLSHQ